MRRARAARARSTSTTTAPDASQTGFHARLDARRLRRIIASDLGANCGRCSVPSSGPVDSVLLACLVPADARRHLLSRTWANRPHRRPRWFPGNASARVRVGVGRCPRTWRSARARFQTWRDPRVGAVRACPPFSDATCTSCISHGRRVFPEAVWHWVSCGPRRCRARRAGPLRRLADVGVTLSRGERPECASSRRAHAALTVPAPGPA